jgi:hypothetical protein
VRAALAAIWDILRYDGPHYLVWRGLTRAASLAGEMSVEILFQMDLTAERPYRPPRLPMELSLVREEELEFILRRITGLEGGRIDELLAIHSARLRRGERCWVARVGREVVHLNWTCFRWAEALPGLPLLLREGEICTTDAHTPPRWRGRGIHEYVLNEMLRAAQREGIRKAFTITELYNRRSRRALMRLGWKPQSRVFYFHATRLKRLFVLPLGGDVEPFFRSRGIDVEAL